jgi:osmoprotectant transport system substrate-binding protein
MRIVRIRVIGATLVALAVLLGACGSGDDEDEPGTSGEEDKGSITVGVSGAFTENQLVAEMYAQMLDHHGYDVDRQLDLGSREISQPALESGEIDVKPEYLGSLLLFLDPEAAASGDPAETAGLLDPLLADKDLTLLDYSGANDTNAFVVTQETADEFSLATVSDLAPVAGDLTLGGPPECPERPFCLIGLEETYSVEFGDFKPLDVGGPITVKALDGGKIDVALLFSTNPQIAANGWVLLEDDKGLQQAENIAPVIRNDVLDDDVKEALNGISAALTTENITALIARIDIDGEELEAVATDFLESEGMMD